MCVARCKRGEGVCCAWEARLPLWFSAKDRLMSYSKRDNLAE